MIPLTPSEFLALLRRGNPLAVEAAEAGVVLRDDFGLLGVLSRSRGRPGSAPGRSSGGG